MDEMVWCLGCELRDRLIDELVWALDHLGDARSDVAAEAAHIVDVARTHVTGWHAARFVLGYPESPTNQPRCSAVERSEGGPGPAPRASPRR